MLPLLLDAINDVGQDIDNCWSILEPELRRIEEQTINIQLANDCALINRLRVRALSDWHALVYAQGAMMQSATFKWPEFSIRSPMTHEVEFLRDETLYKLLDLNFLNPLQFINQQPNTPVIVLTDQEFAISRSHLVLDHFDGKDCDESDCKEYARGMCCMFLFDCVSILICTYNSHNLDELNQPIWAAPRVGTYGSHSEIMHAIHTLSLSIFCKLMMKIVQEWKLKLDSILNILQNQLKLVDIHYNLNWWYENERNKPLSMNVKGLNIKQLVRDIDVVIYAIYNAVSDDQKIFHCAVL
eukprot:977004_1